MDNFPTYPQPVIILWITCTDKDTFGHIFTIDSQEDKLIVPSKISDMIVPTWNKILLKIELVKTTDQGTTSTPEVYDISLLASVMKKEDE